MTYYEELGVNPTASPEEIRKAYKRLARLLHPDKLQDKQARHVAECQMRRLNGVYETLCDAEKRRLYDISLEPPPPPVAPAAVINDEEQAISQWTWSWHDMVAWLRGPNVVWAAASVLAVVLLAYALSDAGRAPAAQTNAESGVAAAKAPVMEEAKPGGVRTQAGRHGGDNESNVTQQITQMEAQLRELNDRNEAARARIHQLERQIRETPPVVAGGQPELPRTPEPAAVPAAGGLQAAASPAVERTAQGTVQKARPAGVSGSWFYARAPGSRARRETYAAEYIEAFIQEENGVLLGRYKARYKVTDRAISPDVAFEFRGRADAPRLPWAGAGSAKGDVRLRLLSENTLEIAWVASDLGGLGLGSGTAVLVRRLDRQ